MLPTTFRSILAKLFQSRRFLEIDQSDQELPVAAIFVNGSGRNEQFHRGPLIDASYQVLVHLAKWFQRRRFQKSANHKQ